VRDAVRFGKLARASDGDIFARVCVVEPMPRLWLASVALVLSSSPWHAAAQSEDHGAGSDIVRSCRERTQPWARSESRATPSPTAFAGGEAFEVERTEREWYGWQNLIADGVLLTVVVVGLDSPVSALGLGTLMIASPVLHWVHGNLGAGLLSLAIRTVSTGVLLVGAASGLEDDISGAEEDHGAYDALAIAGLIGILTAVVLDSAVLAYETQDARASDASPSLRPWADARAGGGGVEFALRFP
jgi:hypothetical protein